MSPRQRGIALQTVLGVVLTAVAVSVTATGPAAVGTGPVLFVTVSVGLPFVLAAVLRARFPARRLGALLTLIGIVYFVRSLAAASDPLLYSLARTLGQTGEVLLLWLMLAFPSGHLQSRTARGIVVAGALAVVLLWWPVVLLSPEIPRGGFQVRCGEDCPANALLVADLPGLVNVLDTAFRVLAGGLLLAVAAYLALRLWRASALSRSILVPVAVASIARAVATAAFVVLGAPDWVRGILVVTYWAILVAIVVGLIRARAFDAAALQRLVGGLRTRPGPEELRAVMARALGDASLDILYWLPDAQSYAGADGLPVVLPAPGAGRAVIEVADEAGASTAALVHDAALLDHPELLEALAQSAVIALQTNRLEAEAAAGRAGTIAAVDGERRRIERDLHDGAQQRLIALRMKLAVAERLLDRDEARARILLVEAGGDVDAAFAEMRALAHGIVPPALAEHGLSAAIGAVARVAALPVHVDAPGIPRFPAEVETQAFFVICEALQNAAKHAGEGASVRIEIEAEPGLRFR